MVGAPLQPLIADLLRRCLLLTQTVLLVGKAVRDSMKTLLLRTHRQEEWRRLLVGWPAVDPGFQLEEEKWLSRKKRQECLLEKQAVL